MAVLDLERNAVVIRIVYDGPPHAGKTTSVRALARSLGRSVEAPGEVAGRTMFFDWMDYTGGLFEGHQIRCQVISVPGQRHLAARRDALLATADVVVFVADTADRDSLDASAGHIHWVAEALRQNNDPPVGVIVQANKRDLPGAVPRDEVRRVLGDDFARVALTESVADTGDGIRETFVLAVRLALDRIRELMVRGALPLGRPPVETSQDLLAALDNLTTNTASTAPAGEMIDDDDTFDEMLDDTAEYASPPAHDIASAIMSVVASPRPRLPDTRVPSGAIWPPVEGRMVLHEATANELTIQRMTNGDWVGGGSSRWRVHSSDAAVFSDFDDGRAALLAWARFHAAHTALLSPSRCVVLAEAAPELWRLWQIVRLAPSLRMWLAEASGLDALELLDRLAIAAALLGEIHARAPDSRILPTLDTIGRGEHGAQLVALMPAPSAPPPPPITDITAHVTRELARLLCSDLAERRSDLAHHLMSRAPATRWHDVVATALVDRVPPFARLSPQT